MDPDRDGHTFSGWYKEETCENKWDFDTDVVTSDITLFAKWTEAKYNIIVEDDGHGTAKALINSVDVTSVTEGSTVTLNASPAEGYTFREWQIVSGLAKDAIKDNSFTMPSNDVRVKAVFAQVPVVYNTVNASVQNGHAGIISASSVAMRQDESYTFAAKVTDTGYYIGRVYVDGVNVGTPIQTDNVYSYTYKNTDVSY